MDRRPARSRFFVRRFVFFLSLCLAFMSPFAASQQTAPGLELSRTVRAWEFLPVVGMRAGLFGTENGCLEAWVYPLKIFRAFHLTFHVGGRALPAESLARTLTVRPESATLIYVGDSFRIKETLFVPVREPGAVIVIEVETARSTRSGSRFCGRLRAGVAGGDRRHLCAVGREPARGGLRRRNQKVLRPRRLSNGGGCAPGL